MMRKVILFLVVISASFTARAQQDAMFSHYMFNTQAINPGYVGSRECTFCAEISVDKF